MSSPGIRGLRNWLVACYSVGYIHSLSTIFAFYNGPAEERHNLYVGGVILLASPLLYTASVASTIAQCINTPTEWAINKVSKGLGGDFRVDHEYTDKAIYTTRIYDASDSDCRSVWEHWRMSTFPIKRDTVNPDLDVK